MNHFVYREKELYCEDIPVRRIAEKVGTPLYIYSHATLKRHFKAFSDAFKGVDSLICFSAKANTSLAVLRLFSNFGGGLDIVSGGELYRGLKAGFSPEKIVYSGVGKRIDEIDYALETDILMFNIESLEELDLINKRAGIIKKKARISIRVNPDVDPRTHPYISTGMKKNKFGINNEFAVKGYKTAMGLENVKIVGIDCHIGSQITEIKPFVEALHSLKLLIKNLEDYGININYLDMGGGLGITYNDEAPPQPAEYAGAIKKYLGRTKLKLILEPGRVIVGNAGVLVTKVLYRKSTDVKEFIIVDAGMNDLVRPTLYKAFHAIKPVVVSGEGEIVADIVGPICESGDFLALDRYVQRVHQGDLLAVMSAGAYGFVMSSNYCSRLRIPEVMVRDDKFYVVRKRQKYEDLTRDENIPSFL
ncbi:MAG: diaminopimelate decarboxylase [Desulfobacteraceae bacterium]|nr:MAG: diaminopimelate decarboxylase [Desulfobacteraceae bacterium]